MRLYLATLLIGCGIAPAVADPPDRPAVKTDLGFDVNKVAPPDPAKGCPVARVFDQYIYAEQLDGKSPAKDDHAVSRLRGLVGQPLFRRLKEREKIAATPQHLAQLETFFEKARERRIREGKETRADDKSEAKGRRAIYTQMVEQWMLNRLLHKRYGGTVIWQQFNPQEPVEAYRGFLEDAERTGAFAIYDKKDREAFFHYYTRKHPFVVKPAEVDFEKPWWLRFKDQE